MSSITWRNVIKWWRKLWTIFFFQEREIPRHLAEHILSSCVIIRERQPVSPPSRPFPPLTQWVVCSQSRRWCLNSGWHVSVCLPVCETAILGTAWARWLGVSCQLKSVILVISLVETLEEVAWILTNPIESKAVMCVQGVTEHFLTFGSLSSSLGAQTVKNPPAVWETWVQSLGWEDPLEEGIATHSSILAWRIPMDRKAWQATVHGVTKRRTQLSN